MDRFKRVASNAKTMTLRHPKGHEIKVATGALSKAMRDQLMALPEHFYDGGMSGQDNSVMQDAPPMPGAPQPIVINVGGQSTPMQSAPLAPSAPPAPLQVNPQAYQMAQNTASLQPQNQRTAAFDPTSQEGQQQIGDQAQDLVYGDAIKSRQNQMDQADTAKSKAQTVLDNYNHLAQRAADMHMPPPPVTSSVLAAQKTLSGDISTSASAPADGVAAPGDAPMSAQLPTVAKQTAFDMGADVEAKALKSGLGQRIAGVNAEANAMGDLGKQNAAINQEQMNAEAELNKKTEMNFKNRLDEGEKFIQAIKDNHIDPNRYMGSLTTGERVQTVIGLILGGIGGGLLHQENAAQKQLNMLIDHDIDAQKNEQSKKMTLFKANMEQFGTEQAATEATRAQMKGYYALKLSQAANNAQSPIQAARAQQAAGQMWQEASTHLGTVARTQAIQEMVRNQQSTGEALNGGQKIEQLKLTGQIDKQEAKELHEELDKARNLISARDNVLSALAQVRELNTVANRLGNPRQTQRQIDLIRGPALEKLVRDSAGRITPESVKLLEPIFSKIMDSDETYRRAVNSVNNLVGRDMHFSRLETHGISYDKQSRFNSTGQKKLQLGPPKI